MTVTAKKLLEVSKKSGIPIEELIEATEFDPKTEEVELAILNTEKRGLLELAGKYKGKYRDLVLEHICDVCGLISELKTAYSLTDSTDVQEKIGNKIGSILRHKAEHNHFLEHGNFEALPLVVDHGDRSFIIRGLANLYKGDPAKLFDLIELADNTRDVENIRHILEKEYSLPDKLHTLSQRRLKSDSEKIIDVYEYWINKLAEKKLDSPMIHTNKAKKIRQEVLDFIHFECPAKDRAEQMINDYCVDEYNKATDLEKKLEIFLEIVPESNAYKKMIRWVFRDCKNQEERITVFINTGKKFRRDSFWKMGIKEILKRYRGFSNKISFVKRLIDRGLIDHDEADFALNIIMDKHQKTEDLECVYQLSGKTKTARKRAVKLIYEKLSQS